jgi:hypothetical protein
MRQTGDYLTATTLHEPVRAFVPHPLPPSEPALATASYLTLNHAAELALARLSGVAGLVPSVDWLLYGDPQGGVIDFADRGHASDPDRFVR